jgi:hypothetical protein
MLASEPPFDILYLIVSLIGRPPHPHAFTVDSANLLSLCLVSRSFNRAATPFLYSTISLSSEWEVESLAKTAKMNPRLLTMCHSLSCVHLIDSLWESVREIASSANMPTLRRYLRRGFTDLPEMLQPHDNVSEVYYPSCRMNIRSIRHLGSFVHLERFSALSINFEDTSIVDALLSVPRLTHVILSEWIPEQPVLFEWLDGLVKVLAHPNLKRMMLGWFAFASGPETMACEEVLMSLPDSIQAKAMMFKHGYEDRRYPGWLIDQIVDGTIWEME